MIVPFWSVVNYQRTIVSDLSHVSIGSLGSLVGSLLVV